MLTVKELFETLQGLSPDAQVVVGIMNGGAYNAAYANQQVRTLARVDGEQRLTLVGTPAPALYICCYESPRPWEGEAPRPNPDGTATLEFDPSDG